jgi:cbb3-type cytochrome oxidase subunit 3
MSETFANWFALIFSILILIAIVWIINDSINKTKFNGPSKRK